MDAKYQLLLCISNKNIAFGKIAPVFSSIGRIGTISAEHFGVLRKKFKSTSPVDDQKIILIDIDSGDISDRDIEIKAAAFGFSLNYFMENPGIVINKAFILKRLRVMSAISAHFIPTAAVSEATEKQKYRLRPDAKPIDIENIVKYTTKSLSSESSMLLTVNKYNSAMSKTSMEEKIIDISICMESIFPSSTEISFRFALYHAICSTENKEDRYDRFKLLKDLYTARSKIVHGSDSKKYIKKIEKQWDLICKISAVSIFYKIIYLQAGEAEDWQKHLGSGLITRR